MNRPPDLTTCISAQNNAPSLGPGFARPQLSRPHQRQIRASRPLRRSPCIPAKQKAQSSSYTVFHEVCASCSANAGFGLKQAALASHGQGIWHPTNSAEKDWLPRNDGPNPSSSNPFRPTVAKPAHILSAQPRTVCRAEDNLPPQAIHPCAEFQDTTCRPAACNIGNTEYRGKPNVPASASSTSPAALNADSEQHMKHKACNASWWGIAIFLLK